MNLYQNSLSVPLTLVQGEGKVASIAPVEELAAPPLPDGGVQEVGQELTFNEPAKFFIIASQAYRLVVATSNVFDKLS